MMRILNAESTGYCDEARATLHQLGEVSDGVRSRLDLLAQVPLCDILIVRLAYQIDQEVLAAGRRLQVIVSATTGLDHIDLDEAQARGITVLSLQGETAFLRTVSATAEYTWALLLALLRRIPWAFASCLDGAWNRDIFRGHELDGKRLGLVGLGRLGQKVAGYGQAFGMEVAAYDPFALTWLDRVRRCASLPTLLRQSDVLSIHAPLNASTMGMMGANELAHLPRRAVVINTSRGELIDEVALVEALAQGHLAGAALDVVPNEREDQLRSASLLLEYARSHDHLLITPHIGGATVESMKKTEIFMARKLAAYVRSGRLSNLPMNSSPEQSS